MIMSLVRLLAIGRSLVSIKDKPNHYRMVRWGWPPKFCVPANPFVAASQPTSSPNAAEAKERSVAGDQQLGSRRTATQTVHAGKPMSKAVAPVAKAASKFLDALNPFTSKVRLKLHYDTRRAAKQPVQCELSLEKVTVVRNDLSDADVEVVPVRCAPAKSLAKVDAAMAARTLTCAAGLGEQAESSGAGEIVRSAC